SGLVVRFDVTLITHVLPLCLRGHLPLSTKPNQDFLSKQRNHSEYGIPIDYAN
ncbi:uncharacterized protein METZ01_LOCUS364617, partial [marine metagenome]